MNVILIAVIVLAAIGLIAAAVLFVASKKFAVYEDPRIGQVAALLPQANCGGCGYPGCSGFAQACVKAADAGSMDGVSCPVGGAEVMKQVAGVLGMAAGASAPKVAVVRCNGTCQNRPHNVHFDGAHSCRIQQMTGMGETGCTWGCLGCGDCAEACQFGAITINEELLIAEVDDSKCTACGACAKACPRNIIEIRKTGPKLRRVVVKCNSRDKGALANKVCKASCIGCGKCVKTCDKFEAIVLKDNLAYIDPEKCKMCRKCEEACPKGAIEAVGFPPRKPKPEGAAAPKPATAAKPAASKPEGAPAAAAPKPATTATKPEAASKPAETKPAAKPETASKPAETKPAAAPAASPAAENAAAAEAAKPVQAAPETAAATPAADTKETGAGDRRTLAPETTETEPKVAGDQNAPSQPAEKPHVEPTETKPEA